MSTAMQIAGAGITWLVVALILAIVVCRRFVALEVRQAEVTHLRPLRVVDDEDEGEGVVVPFDRGSAA